MKISIPAGSAILLKITIEGDWKGEGFVESMLPEEQDSGRKLVLPETANKLSGEVQGVENHMEEEIEICTGQRLGKILLLEIDKEAWIKEELPGSKKLEVKEDGEETLFKNVNLMQESDYPTEECKKKFICESFKKEVIKLF